jgi:hypothetical protein
MKPKTGKLMRINAWTNINMLRYDYGWGIRVTGTIPNELLNLVMMPVQYFLFA